jgi:hypothetical protein
MATTGGYGTTKGGESQEAYTATYEAYGRRPEMTMQRALSLSTEDMLSGMGYNNAEISKYKDLIPKWSDWKQDVELQKQGFGLKERAIEEGAFAQSEKFTGGFENLVEQIKGAGVKRGFDLGRTKGPGSGAKNMYAMYQKGLEGSRFAEEEAELSLEAGEYSTQRKWWDEVQGMMAQIETARGA